MWCARRPATLTRGSLPYLYRIDGLHPNARGYERWTAVIKPLLEEAALATGPDGLRPVSRASGVTNRWLLSGEPGAKDFIKEWLRG